MLWVHYAIRDWHHCRLSRQKWPPLHRHRCRRNSCLCCRRPGCPWHSDRMTLGHLHLLVRTHPIRHQQSHRILQHRTCPFHWNSKDAPPRPKHHFPNRRPNPIGLLLCPATDCRPQRPDKPTPLPRFSLSSSCVIPLVSSLQRQTHQARVHTRPQHFPGSIHQVSRPIDVALGVV